MRKGPFAPVQIDFKKPLKPLAVVVVVRVSRAALGPQKWILNTQIYLTGLTQRGEGLQFSRNISSFRASTELSRKNPGDPFPVFVGIFGTIRILFVFKALSQKRAKT